MAFFSIGSVTDSSIKVSVTIDSGYTYWRVFCRLADDPDDQTYDDKRARSGNFSVTISGLYPETEYVVNVGYSNSSTGGVDGWLGGQYVTTEAEEDIPSVDIDPWSWTASNGSATAAQTQAAYNVLMGTATVDNFSHKVWNDLVDKVAEVHLADTGHEWDIDYGNYLSKAACKVFAGDALSAEIYNAVRYNVGSVISTGITDVSRGDEITGYHIIRLAERLNAYINTL